MGAVLTDAKHRVLGVGWNDVPKFGGGLYTQDSKPDHRCMVRTGLRCSNDFEKDMIADAIASEICKKLEIPKEIKPDEITRVIRASKIKDLIEFSRAVHAEMMAIINSSARATETIAEDSRPKLKLYVTTYPCHSCARHIIATGISEVIYVEPYRKSLAIHLHSDAWSDEGSVAGKVVARPFEGVGPSRYVHFFQMPDCGRKDARGEILKPAAETANFTSVISLESFPELEGLIIRELQRRGLAMPPASDQNLASS